MFRTTLARITRRQSTPVQPTMPAWVADALARQARAEQATPLPAWVADALARGEGNR